MKICDILLTERDYQGFTSADIELVKKEYTQGKSIANIAKDIKRTKKTVNRLLAELIDAGELTQRRSLHRAFTPTETEIVKQQYQQGKSADDIAKAIERDKATVYWFIRRLIKAGELNQLHRVRRAFTPTETEIVKQQYQQGKSADDIAKAIERDQGTVYWFIRRLIKTGELNQLHSVGRSFTTAELNLCRTLYVAGYGPTSIASQIKENLGLERHPRVVSKKIKSFDDYYTILLPTHLDNLQKLSGTSQQEIDFFNQLAKINSLPRFERNVQIPGTRYNADGLDTANHVIVEFFGTLWHADPIKYPDDDQWLNRLSCTAGDIRKKDKIKLERLTGMGYKVVVIWQREWKNVATRQACLDRVRDAIS
jgi:predicted transcriptional regulator